MKLAFVVAAFSVCALAQSTVPAVSSTGITNIGKLMDSCPDKDAAYTTIRADFLLLREGAPIAALDCAEPVSKLPRPRFNQELILSQVLRVIYYMDRGRSGYLPWTSLRLYDWLKTKIDGIDIRSIQGASAYCCETLNGKRLFVTQDYNQIQNLSWDAYRSFFGMPGLIGLISHEARHVDGFPHATCCANPGNCDQTYDESNLSAVGIQNWIWRAFLDGTINVDANCLPGQQVEDFTTNFIDAANRANGPAWFCDNKPPLAVRPANPGGACPFRMSTSLLAPNAIANAASYHSGVISPGEIVTIFGGGIGTDTPSENLVYVNGVAAPLLYTSPNQISAVVPFATTGQSAFFTSGVFVEVESRGMLTNYVKLPFSATDPGFFTLDGSIAAFNEDGSLNTRGSPARKGSIVAAYFTGGGVTDPPSIDGQVNTAPLPQLRNPCRVFVQGTAAELQYCGPAPGLIAGADQVNFRIPANSASGAVPVILGPSGTSATVWVQ